jgi:hypothetical protein
VAVLRQMSSRIIEGIETRFIKLRARKFFGSQSYKLYGRDSRSLRRSRQPIDCLDRPDLAGDASEVVSKWPSRINISRTQPELKSNINSCGQSGLFQREAKYLIDASSAGHGTSCVCVMLRDVPLAHIRRRSGREAASCRRENHRPPTRVGTRHRRILQRCPLQLSVGRRQFKRCYQHVVQPSMNASRQNCARSQSSRLRRFAQQHYRYLPEVASHSDCARANEDGRVHVYLQHHCTHHP